MDMTWWFVAIELLLWAQQLLAQKSQVSCLPSFDWARNDKGQDPCIVAAILQADCRNEMNVTIEPLAPNEIYPGPDPQNTNDICACNSVVYSLLSACAACQDRFFIDWPSWTKHCALSYLKFPVNVPSDTVVPVWAFDSISPNCSRFDIDVAIAVAISGNKVPVSTSTSVLKDVGSTTSSSSFIATSSSPSPTIPEPASTSNPSTTGAHKNPMLIGAVVGSIVATASVIFGLCFLGLRARRRWARRSSTSSTVAYSRLPLFGMGGKPMEKGGLSSPPAIFRIPAEDMGITTRPSEISHSQILSRISLPNYMQSQSLDGEPYSPAQASSDIFTNMGGHSESHFGGHVSAPNSASSRHPSLLSKLRPLRGSTLPSSLQSGLAPEGRSRGISWAKDDSTLDIRRY